MLQKSGDHQFGSIVYPTIYVFFFSCLIHPFLPSTAARLVPWMTGRTSCLTWSRARSHKDQSPKMFWGKPMKFGFRPYSGWYLFLNVCIIMIYISYMQIYRLSFWYFYSIHGIYNILCHSHAVEKMIKHVQYCIIHTSWQWFFWVWPEILNQHLRIATLCCYASFGLWSSYIHLVLTIQSSWPQMIKVRQST